MGWVLLLPPWEDHGAQAPLARWQHIASFSSAGECEAVRDDLIHAARRPLRDPWAIPGLHRAGRVESKVWWTDSRCVPRDDRHIGRSPDD